MGRSLYYLCPPCPITYTLLKTLPVASNCKILSKNSKDRLGPPKRHKKKEELCDGQGEERRLQSAMTGLDQLFTSLWCLRLRSESVLPHSSSYKCSSSDDTFMSIIQRLKPNISTQSSQPQNTTGQTSLLWLPWLINCFTGSTWLINLLTIFFKISTLCQSP